MDAIWIVALGVILELGCSEQKGQVLVVIKAPDSMRTRWFEIIVSLKSSHKLQVALENPVDKDLVIVD